jgi:septal ring factor EnvC (AmiA/AmiB activator)
MSTEPEQEQTFEKWWSGLTRNIIVAKMAWHARDGGIAALDSEISELKASLDYCLEQLTASHQEEKGLRQRMERMESALKSIRNQAGHPYSTWAHEALEEKK